MEIRAITDAAELDALVATQPLQPFLQAWAWGEFQRALGRTIWRLGAYDGRRLVGAATVIQHDLQLNVRYLYCPRGPIAQSPEAISPLVAAIQDLGRQQRAMYVKLDPGLAVPPMDWSSIVSDGTLGTTLQPKQTRVLDVGQDPQALLEQMHQKTRYNIRLAEKRGVTTRWSTSDADMNAFLRLMHQTADRQGIRLHSDAYYKKLFTTLSAVGAAELILGEYQGEVRAAHMIIWQGATATYLHGGSDESVKDAMVPYALQWQTILRAHERGCREYDLWGVSPADVSDHSWAGVTRFKNGFGGRYVEFPPALNLVLQPQWYQVYRWIKRLRGGVDE